jgi:hypothetical protein
MCRGRQQSIIIAAAATTPQQRAAACRAAPRLHRCWPNLGAAPLQRRTASFVEPLSRRIMPPRRLEAWLRCRAAGRLCLARFYDNEAFS